MKSEYEDYVVATAFGVIITVAILMVGLLFIAFGVVAGWW